MFEIYFMEILMRHHYFIQIYKTMKNIQEIVEDY